MTSHHVQRCPIVRAIREGKARGLTLHQALALYLCDDPDGPHLGPTEAASLLGLGARQEIDTHLRRARAAIGVKPPAKD